MADPFTHAQGGEAAPILDVEDATVRAGMVDLFTALVRKAGEQDEAIDGLTRMAAEQAGAIDDLRAKLALVEAALAVQAETNKALHVIVGRLNDGLRPDGSPMLAAGGPNDGR